MQPNLINNLSKNTSRRQKILAIIILCIMLTGIIVVVFLYSRQNSDALPISNINKYLAEAPAKDKDILQQSLWLIAPTNDSDANSVTATIREDSFQETVDGDMHSTKFLIDIDSIKQTYVVSFTWSNTTQITDGVIIDCPDPKDSKYPESYCTGMYNNSDNLYPMAGTIVWEHLYQLNCTYGQNSTTKTIDSLKPFILENYPNNSGIAVIIDETSLRKIPNQPGVSYQLSVKINDLTADLVIQTDEGFGDQYIFVYMQDQSSQKYTAQLLANDQNIINSTTSWAKNYFSAPNLKINISSLN